LTARAAGTENRMHERTYHGSSHIEGLFGCVHGRLAARGSRAGRPAAHA